MSNILPQNILTSPDVYFKNKQKSLDERIQEVSLTTEEESNIIASKTAKTIRNNALGLFKIGEIINTFLNWNDEVDSELKEAKKEYLLAAYFDKTEQLKDSIQKIEQLLTNPQGNTLFNKIIRILDNTPPDIELTNHLANVLKNIVDSDFNALFDDHKFALNQIEMLTPQALTILSDFKNWPRWKLNGYSSNGPRLTSDWLPDFVNAYAATKNITDAKTKSKITHSMNDLIKNRYTEGILTTQELVAVASLNDIAKIIIKYIQ